MSVLPTSANVSLLALFWAIAFVFFTGALVLCLAIVLRRVRRNHILAKRKIERTAFQAYISAQLVRPPSEGTLQNAPNCHIGDVTTVLLHYFRTLKGEQYEQLKDLITGSDIEAGIIRSSYHGVRGARMRAVRVLSHLNSQSSTHVIFDKLGSVDKYVRITAAKSLVQRGSRFFLGDIINSINDAFPTDVELLAGIISNFGNQIVAPLEDYIRTSDNPIAKAACLEALSQIMPAKTSLNLGTLMNDPSEAVRAATLSVSVNCAHFDDSDPLRLALVDDAISVKIRAAKLACTLRRADVTSELYALTNSSEMWVRYWALRAIWTTGTSGQRFVEALRKTNPLATDVALEMRSGYV